MPYESGDIPTTPETTVRNCIVLRINFAEGPVHQSQFEKKNQRVFFFEQTAQASTCQTFQDLGLRRSGATPRSSAHSGGFSSVNIQAANLISQPLRENFKMSIETILVIGLVVFLLGGGGWDRSEERRHGTDERC